MDWLNKKKKEKKKKEKKKKKQRLVRGRERGAKLLEDIIECCDGKSNPIKFFSTDQIIKATNNFSESNRLPGLCEPWYSGKIDNHPMIFLKVEAFNVYERRDYYREITMSSMVSGHKNFLKLLGCCLEFGRPVIAYNFIKMSDLDLEMVVSWKKRIKIAEDIAIALAYLHTAFPRPFVYRRMSLENILLDEDGVARLCDFSLCISIPQGETFVQVDKTEGTYGYMDENYKRTGRVSEKTDVFAIGILMQMLLTGQKEETRKEDNDRDGEDDDSDGDEAMSRTTSMYNYNFWTPRWLTKEQRMDEIADPKMLEKMDEVGEEELCQMKAFLMLSMRCTGRTNWEIPNMVEVAKELKNIQRSSFPSSVSGEEEIIIDSAQGIFSSSSFASFASYASGAGETKIDFAQGISSSSSLASFASYASYASGAGETKIDSAQDTSSSVLPN